MKSEFIFFFLSIIVCSHALNPNQDDEDICPNAPFPTDDCPINCILPDPVCGFDGVTYTCGCQDAHCAGVRVAKLGPCNCENGVQSLTARDLEIRVSDGLNVVDVSQSFCPGVTKEKWPELLGTPAKFAKQIIQKENPKLTDIPTILIGTAVTQDLRCNRVRLFVNVLDFVVQTPVVG